MGRVNAGAFTRRPREGVYGIFRQDWRSKTFTWVCYACFRVCVVGSKSGNASFLLGAKVGKCLLGGVMGWLCSVIILLGGVIMFIRSSGGGQVVIELASGRRRVLNCF